MQAPMLPDDLGENVAQALAEDIGSGDLTAILLPEDSYADAEVLCRDDCILSGQFWFDEVFRQLDDRVAIAWRHTDGDAIIANTVVCSLNGPVRALLTGERAALNFLQTLSATATQTRRYVDAVAGTTAHILDTRKTLPGLRAAQKYAVRCGGGYNHRTGLYDGILIKENHIAAAGGIAAALQTAQTQAADGVFIEIEVETLDELTQALDADAQRLLLDNFSLEMLEQAVARNAGRARLEASGGVNLNTVGAIANTGVDDISVGDLTKSVTAIDLSMRLK
ncbi:MAG: carboxylating nicotinate-nucleotide diphosphorylase [Gammaproteobacteria bacterium]|nr:MAG: carboxylating nicotinate-nucleotide diphosphorylase [Gammaproteobacteria bacterium]